MIDSLIIAVGVIVALVVIYLIYDSDTFSYIRQKDDRPLAFHDLETGNESPIRDDPKLVGLKYNFFLGDDKLPEGVPIKNIIRNNPLNPKVRNTGKQMYYYVSPVLAEKPYFKAMMTEAQNESSSLRRQRDQLKDIIKESQKYRDVVQSEDLKTLKRYKDIFYYKPEHRGGEKDEFA